MGVKEGKAPEKPHLWPGNDLQDYFGKATYIIDPELSNTDNCMHKVLGQFLAILLAASVTELASDHSLHDEWRKRKGKQERLELFPLP